jgi:hypothetical protein
LRFEQSSPITERLYKWHDQINVLRSIEEKFFILEASEKTFFSELYLEADGKNVAEKEAKVYASYKWKEFAKGLAISKSMYNHEKRTLELKIKAYEAEYLNAKLEAEAIRKMA